MNVIGQPYFLKLFWRYNDLFQYNLMPKIQQIKIHTYNKFVKKSQNFIKGSFFAF